MDTVLMPTDDVNKADMLQDVACCGTSLTRPTPSFFRHLQVEAE